MKPTSPDRSEIRRRYEALDMSRMTKEDFDAEQQKAIDSARGGNTKSFSSFYREFRNQRTHALCGWH